MAEALVQELANPDVAVLLARGAGRLAGVAITLDRHPAPADPDPWLGLLLIDAGEQRKGYGREMAGLVEERFRARGRAALRRALTPRRT